MSRYSSPSYPSRTLPSPFSRSGIERNSNNAEEGWKQGHTDRGGDRCQDRAFYLRWISRQDSDAEQSHAVLTFIIVERLAVTSLAHCRLRTAGQAL